MDKSIIEKYLKSHLTAFGLFEWYRATTGSVYYKFRDCRLGSIRIADHRSRNKYNYTYTINPKQTTPDTLYALLKQIELKAFCLEDFDPLVWMVYDSRIKSTKIVGSEAEYRRVIKGSSVSRVRCRSSSNIYSDCGFSPHDWGNN